MNRNQYNELVHKAPDQAMITVAELEDQSDRTLIYGYTLDRSTFHVYLKDGAFNVVIYKGGLDKPSLINHMTEREIINPQDVIPSKRVYPRHSDYEFCKLIKSKGHSIPFTTYEDQLLRYPYAGKRYEELIE